MAQGQAELRFVLRSAPRGYRVQRAIPTMSSIGTRPAKPQGSTTFALALGFRPRTRRRMSGHRLKRAVQPCPTISASASLWLLHNVRCSRRAILGLRVLRTRSCLNRPLLNLGVTQQHAAIGRYASPYHSLRAPDTSQLRRPRRCRTGGDGEARLVGS